MKTGVLICTRGDRQQFLEHAKRMLSWQSVQPDEVIIIDYSPTSKECDLVPRYRKGINSAIEKNIDFLIFWEDDDWYSCNYIEWLTTQWKEYNKPELFGISETYYYHLKINKRRYLEHPNRASLFNTAIIPSRLLRHQYPNDNEPYLDLHLWKYIKGQVVEFPCYQSGEDAILSVGIKHGIGLPGGHAHNDKSKLYNGPDERAWFEKTIDSESLKFYDKITQQWL